MNKNSIYLWPLLLGAAIFFVPYLTSNVERQKMIQKTFAIIKPDAVKNKDAGKIIDLIEKNSFSIIRMQKLTFSKEQAEKFYDVHKDKPFFGELVEFITSGPSIIMVLEKENAINAWRNLMGATDPAKAEEGTIRKLYGSSIGENATHGSDAQETAQQEITLFYPELI